MPIVIVSVVSYFLILVYMTYLFLVAQRSSFIAVVWKFENDLLKVGFSHSIGNLLSSVCNLWV